MRYLESVPTQLRVYRGILQSLGTYERLEVAARSTFERYELDARFTNPQYIGASLLRSREYAEARRRLPELRRYTPDQIEEEIRANLPRTQYDAYDVRLEHAYIEGSTRQGFRLNLGFEDPLFTIERYSVFRALGTLAGKEYVAAGDTSITLCSMRLPMPAKVIETMEAHLPQTIYVEPPIISVFAASPKRTYEH